MNRQRDENEVDRVARRWARHETLGPTATSDFCVPQGGRHTCRRVAPATPNAGDGNGGCGATRPTLGAGTPKTFAAKSGASGR